MKKLCLVFLVLFSFSSSQVYAKEAQIENTGQLIIVNKNSNQLSFYDNHQLVGTFKVATGREESFTPVGTFSIIFKVKNPWYKDLVKGGSPQNPLGYRWMGLDARGTGGDTYGIHGNNNEDSIGTYASAGCIRMHNDEDIWLYERVKEGTKVIIISSSKPFDAIAVENGYILNAPDTQNIDTKVTTNFKTYLYAQNIGSGSFTQTFETVPSGTILNAFQQKGSWYHVHTANGDKWISNATAVEGELSKTATKLTLAEPTNLYFSPNTSVIEDTLKPQEIESFEHIGEWFHVHLKIGDLWVYQKNNTAVFIEAFTIFLPSFIR